MIPDRSLREPTEVVIWAATSLLALVVGSGAAYFLWYSLRNSQETIVGLAAVVSVSLGLVLVGLGLQRPLTRIFLVLLAATLSLVYALGSPAFARLAP